LKQFCGWNQVPELK